jgi:hypothetical protein
MIQHSSDSVEHYTEPDIIELVRHTMGGIDLDPASCAMAQEVVKAEAWYGPGSEFGEDGLAQPWIGRVYLNPPGGAMTPTEKKDTGLSSRAALWWLKIATAWQEGEIEQAIFMGFALEIVRIVQSLDVVQPLLLPFCVPSQRLVFSTFNREYEKGRKRGKLIDPNKKVGERVQQKQPSHPNIIVYLPPIEGDSWSQASVDRFRGNFGSLGICR